jgi:hypothetical protein
MRRRDPVHSAAGAIRKHAENHSENHAPHSVRDGENVYPIKEP